jgi:hypothetical protein
MSSFAYKASQRDLDRIPKLSIDDKANWLLARKSINKFPQESQNHTQKLHALLTDPAYQLT